MVNRADNKIIVSYQATLNNKKIGCITLNKPKALNALDIDMMQSMQEQLDQWRSDTTVVAVFIDSVSDKAFCAGGDIVSIYHAMKEHQNHSPKQLPDFIADIFEKEYRLDYTLHVFPKPVICWGNGIIMGGGLGVFAGASHKIVTETARIAMPEITIGLFPDVGASYFLNKMPAGVGRFMGLTAASVNAIDCLNIGLADHFILHSAKSSFMMALTKLKLVNANSVSDLSSEFQNMPDVVNTEKSLQGNLSEFMDMLPELDKQQNLSEIEVFLKEMACQNKQNKTLQKALECFTNGSPITAHLVLEELKRGATKSLAECLQMELCMAYQCSITGELQEGIRARLIDKDNQAKWTYAHHSEVPQIEIEKHFNRYNRLSNSSDKNPLSLLEQEYGVSHA